MCVTRREWSDPHVNTLCVPQALHPWAQVCDRHMSLESLGGKPLAGGRRDSGVRGGPPAMCGIAVVSYLATILETRWNDLYFIKRK